ncbi:MAG: glutamine--tRNA ligase/YqeY domain fusion protein [Bacteroidota bacterium]
MKDVSDILGSPRNFIEEEIEKDIREGRVQKPIHTRFPPEPNGYLHIGHAKAICLNFEIAKKYGGKTNLRFDDTNPEKEETKYVEAIKRDISWLGYEWDEREYYASDYFEKLYAFAVQLINQGDAYIEELSAEEIAEYRGVVTAPGRESPYRDRPVTESLELFKRMKDGEFEEGSYALRAKVDMSAPNMHLRDPIIFRVKDHVHHRTGENWKIFPMYDFAHGQSDSIEEITHSLCSLEFVHHRPLYDWFISKLGIYPSRQIEFARMNVEYMITSKRKLLRLVDEGKVSGWDDPRMSTISGMRRRGYPPAAIREFCEKVGIAKRDNMIDMALLESCVRDELNQTATRVMVVVDPIKVTITNYPEDKSELLPLDNNPEDEASGSRQVTFSRSIYIERDDFMLDPPKKYFRMAPGRNVRLKGAYILTCDSADIDEDGTIHEVRCTYYPDSKSGSDTSGIKAKGTLHWADQKSALDVTIHQYDRLFTDPTPDQHDEKDYMDFYNDASLTIVKTAKAEAAIAKSQPGQAFQFMRKGYYVRDSDSGSELIFNRTVELKSSWGKKQKR